MNIGKFIPKGDAFLAYCYDGKGPAPKVDGKAAKKGDMVIVEVVTTTGTYVANKGLPTEYTKPTRTEEFVPVEIVSPEKFRKANDGADDCGRDIISAL